MFRILHRGIGFITDAMWSNIICSIFLLTILFLLFLLTLTIVYINPSVYVHMCDFENSEENVPKITYYESDEHSNTERYIGMTSINRYAKVDCNFFPDLNDIETEVIDETKGFPDPSETVPTDKEGRNDFADQEALASVKMAIKFKQRNNNEKARKLFQHAIDLSPNHPDVLLHYGEFLESTEDFISADHLYSRALVLRPEDSRALANRRRTVPRVSQIDLEELKRIDAKRVALIELNSKNLILKQLKREMYFKHIHHTVAIEGNTMTLEETKRVVETKMPVNGKSILEHNEIQGVESALRYINQTANKKSSITVEDILQIHKRVLGHADPINAGTFRKSQVYIGGYTPPPASDLDVLMDDFVSTLQAPHIRNMHPIHISAFAHLKLVLIHPFVDGNGRTARLLMNLCLMRHGFPPVIIKKEDRSQYFKFIPMANEGYSIPFYRFIAHATEYTIDDFLKGQGLEYTKLEALESDSNISEVIPL